MKQYILALCAALAIGNIYAMDFEFNLETIKPLRIMTFNVRRQGKETDPKKEWAVRKPRVEAIIKKMQPDIVGLQEPTLPQIQSLEDELKKESYAWFGTGRGAEWLGKSENEYNPIFYNTKRFDLLENGTFVLNPSGAFNYKFLWSPSSVGLLTRICTWGKFKDKESGHEFFIYNTHLDNKYEAARINGLTTIIKTIEERKDQLPTIIMGDFNMEITPELESGLLKNFTATRAIAHSKVGPEVTRTGWDFKELKKIDHILISKNAPVDIEQHIVIEESNRDELASDHRPVVVEMSFKR